MDKNAIVKVDGMEYPVTMREKAYKTGSKGYYVWGKITINGKQYQVVGNFIEIGSKNVQASLPDQ